MTPPSGGRHAWAEDGPEELGERLFRIPVPLPNDALRAVNAYLWRGERGDLLIDCGFADQLSWESLTGALRRLGSGEAAIRLLFATHVHGDHLGAAARIREQGGALVTLGLGDRETAQLLAEDPEQARARNREQLIRNGAAQVVDALVRDDAVHPLTPPRSPLPDLFLTGGRLRFEGHDLEILPTPGHTRGHLCLWDPAGQILFSGDHVLPQITPSIGVEVPIGGLPLLDFLRSLDQVRDLPAQLVLPAHGPAFTDLGTRVDELLLHHRLRLQLCLAAVTAGAHSAMAVAETLPWTRRERRFTELDGFNQMLAVGETAAHLELLAERGELRRRLSDLMVEFLPLNEAGRRSLGGSPA